MSRKKVKAKLSFLLSNFRYFCKSFSAVLWRLAQRQLPAKWVWCRLRICCPDQELLEATSITPPGALETMRNWTWGLINMSSFSPSLIIVGPSTYLTFLGRQYHCISFLSKSIIFIVSVEHLYHQRVMKKSSLHRSMLSGKIWVVLALFQVFKDNQKKLIWQLEVQCKAREIV